MADGRTDDLGGYLVSAAQIAAEPGLAKTHFLNPQARRTNLSLGDMTGLTGLGFHIIEVAPGDLSTEHHVHHYEDECVYILSGRAEARIGDGTVEVGPGDFLGYRRGGLAHSLQALGPDPLRCIVVGQRLPHDVGDYPLTGKRIYRNAGMPWDLADVAALEHPNAGAKR
jgi:uncharacterized cupin superfamily protein